MDDSFFEYLQQLELIAFFAGYPLFYAIISIIAGEKRIMGGQIKIIFLLPLSYSIVGLLFLGLQLRNLYPDYSFDHLKETIQNPYLATWGLLALVFFLPALRQRPIFSLLHSLVFFILVLKPIIEHLFGNGTKSIIKNNMKVYTDSLLLNLGVFVIVLLIAFSIHLLKRKKVR